jgi:hypothetical protein
MDNSGFQKIKEIDFTENSARPPGIMRPRMFRQAMIKDRDNNIYAVYGDRLKKGTPDTGQFPWQIYSSQNSKVKVRQGIINNKIQGNLNEEFTCSETCDIYAEASLTYSEDGGYATVVSHVVKKGTVPEAESGLRPAKVYLTIGNVVVEDGAITQILQFIRGYVSGSMVMGASNCTSQSRQWTWFVPSTQFE